ncbi:hypothetical protein OG883_14025 [Streptomyces sp. NBC_01142]|uniref:hypothetical protein n=1 Tax=Streptomyces sp. NBC_01142 TaxID=2975865 RepID=UPI00224F1D9F|nr:hypothetical protein [Streptomyces sp. NBC_01142]MCX4821010.1 hypothetical protein [Streptomyces sp. NBC_01142]
MSGRKRIQVEESEWYRLQREASRLKDIRRSLPGLIKEVRRQTHDDLERVFGVIEDRQRSVEQVVEGLSEQTRRLETETQQRLQAQARRWAEELRASAGELRKETRVHLAEQTHRLRGEIADERRRRQADVQRLATELGELVQDQERAAVIARDALSDARAMHRLIRDTLPHQRYAAGRLASLEQHLDRADGNIAQARFDAALATAQGAYQELSELRLDLEERDREQRYLQVQASERILVVQLQTKSSASQPVYGPEGEVFGDVDLDVDYWSRGELTALRAETTALEQRIKDENQPLEAQELRDIVEHRAPALEQRLAAIVGRAGQRLIASQQRVNLAEAVVQTLEDMTAYELDEVTYLGQDQREAYFAKLVHRNRNEMVIEVAPAEGDSGGSVLRVLSYDHDTAARDELDDRGRALSRQLQAHGIRASEPQAEEGDPDPLYRDFKALGQAPTQTQGQALPSTATES